MQSISFFAERFKESAERAVFEAESASLLRGHREEKRVLPEFVVNAAHAGKTPINGRRAIIRFLAVRTHARTMPGEDEQWQGRA